MKYSQENICAECLLSCNFIKKEALAQGCFCEFCKIFRSRLFTEYIWMTASILQQLLALYFAVTYSWQLLSSEKALVGKKFIHISQHIYILIFFFIFLSFSLTNVCLPCQFQIVCCILSRQLFCWLGDT